MQGRYIMLAHIAWPCACTSKLNRLRGVTNHSSGLKPSEKGSCEESSIPAASVTFDLLEFKAQESSERAAVMIQCES